MLKFAKLFYIYTYEQALGNSGKEELPLNRKNY